MINLKSQSDKKHKECQYFFCVLMFMDERIINYLIVKQLEDENFSAHPHIRIRSAYILAKKEFKRMSEEEKKKISKYLDGKQKK